MMKLMLSCLFCLVAASGLLQGQSTPLADQESALALKEKNFHNYGHDFLDFAKGDEYEPSAGLADTAWEVEGHISAAMALLDVYDSLSCPPDRAAARTIIRRQLGYYSKDIDSEIKISNMGIERTKKPGVAAEATRMRDDLRDVRELFNSIKLD